jgi:short-subunit dehydrogenase
METLFKKKVLIIGATGGIGMELAKLLKSSQADLWLSGRNKLKLNQMCFELDLKIDQTFAANIKDPLEVHSMAEWSGNPDILINLAGIGIIKPLEQLTYEDFNETIDVNLKGAFHILKSYLPGMKALKQGLIINVPGVLGKVPMAGAAAYTASKYGLNGMLKSVREELKRTNIRITNLYLGGTDTAFWDEIDLNVQRDKFVLAKEAAKSIWFLCQQPVSGVVSEMVLQPFNHQAI